MIFVAEILKSKGCDAWTVSPDSSVYDALQLMADKNIGALMVCKDESLVGVFSERDYARKVILKGKASKETLVKEILDAELTCVSPEQTIAVCMELMTNKRTRHLPVLDRGRLVGVISIGDVVKAIIKQQEFTIEQMKHYISGEVC